MQDERTTADRIALAGERHQVVPGDILIGWAKLCWPNPVRVEACHAEWVAPG